MRDAEFQTLDKLMTRGDGLLGFRLVVLDTSIRRDRTARNPRTGELIHLPEERSVAFRPAQVLKKQLSESGKRKDK